MDAKAEKSSDTKIYHGDGEKEEELENKSEPSEDIIPFPSPRELIFQDLASLTPSQRIRFCGLSVTYHSLASWVLVSTQVLAVQKRFVSAVKDLLGEYTKIIKLIVKHEFQITLDSILLELATTDDQIATKGLIADVCATLFSRAARAIEEDYTRVLVYPIFTMFFTEIKHAMDPLHEHKHKENGWKHLVTCCSEITKELSQINSCTFNYKVVARQYFFNLIETEKDRLGIFCGELMSWADKEKLTDAFSHNDADLDIDVEHIVEVEEIVKELCRSEIMDPKFTNVTEKAYQKIYKTVSEIKQKQEQILKISSLSKQDEKPQKRKEKQLLPNSAYKLTTESAPCIYSKKEDIYEDILPKYNSSAPDSSILSTFSEEKHNFATEDSCGSDDISSTSDILKKMERELSAKLTASQLTVSVAEKVVSLFRISDYIFAVWNMNVSFYVMEILHLVLETLVELCSMFQTWLEYMVKDGIEETVSLCTLKMGDFGKKIVSICAKRGITQHIKDISELVNISVTIPVHKFNERTLQPKSRFEKEAYEHFFNLFPVSDAPRDLMNEIPALWDELIYKRKKTYKKIHECLENRPGAAVSTDTLVQILNIIRWRITARNGLEEHNIQDEKKDEGSSLSPFCCFLGIDEFSE